MIGTGIKCKIKDDTEFCSCTLEGILTSLGKSWSMLILTVIGNNKSLRYSEIQKKLGNLNPKTLSFRLKELEQKGLVNRQAFAETPPRVEYRLTEKGYEVYRLLVPLVKWAIRADHHYNVKEHVVS